MISSSRFSIRDDFPPVDYDAWRALAEAELSGVPFEKKFNFHTYENFDFEPLYSRKHVANERNPQGLSKLAPYMRGTRAGGAALDRIDLRQVYSSPDVTAVNREIRDDVAGGATSVELTIGSFEGVNDLDVVLTGVNLAEIGVAFEAGAEYASAALWMADVAKRRGVSLRDARWALNADPLATLARSGELPMSTETALASLTSLATWSAANCQHMTAVGVDTSPYHVAGATAAQDLAFAMSTSLAYLRAMTGASLSVEAAARQLLFRVSLGTHHFLAIAKLRAIRRLWGRVLDACGASDASTGIRIQSRTSDRVLTRCDPYVNVLRNAACVFAGMVGGADVITSVPLDKLIGVPDESARRISRNTLLVLQEEANLHRVIDPAGGSWFLETITDQLAQEGWRIFQEIEQRGGMLVVLESGWVAAQIGMTRAARSQDIALRRQGITGVSEFPNLMEEKLERFAPPAKRPRKAAAKPVVLIAPLQAQRSAAPFEELRDASDNWQSQTGKRPQAFLANFGSASHFAARATYAKNFLQAGGIEAIGSDGFTDVDETVAAFKTSEAKIAILCSSDKLYPELVPNLAAALKRAGARSIVVAGNPGDHEPAWRTAGVDHFIFIKCDVLETLRALLRAEGVL